MVTYDWMGAALKITAAAFLLSVGGNAWAGDGDPAGDSQSPQPVIAAPVSVPDNGGIDWQGLLGQSLAFLAVEHGFRYLTEEGTRHSHLSFFGGYVDSVTNLHGWADGDPFYVNYVGHPRYWWEEGS